MCVRRKKFPPHSLTHCLISLHTFDCEKREKFSFFFGFRFPFLLFFLIRQIFTFQRLELFSFLFLIIFLKLIFFSPNREALTITIRLFLSRLIAREMKIRLMKNLFFSPSISFSFFSGSRGEAYVYLFKKIFL
jgi:hypothetical protein